MLPINRSKTCHPCYYQREISATKFAKRNISRIFDKLERSPFSISILNVNERGQNLLPQSNRCFSAYNLLKNMPVEYQNLALVKVFPIICPSSKLSTILHHEAEIDALKLREVTVVVFQTVLGLSKLKAIGNCGTDTNNI